jgi:hypothetical protein
VTPEDLGTVGVYLSAALSSAGFVAFAALARFWRSRGGWHVFWYMLMVSWVLDLSVIHDLFGGPAWFAWLRAGTFVVGMPLVLGWRSWIVFDLQLLHRYRGVMAYREGRRPEQEEELHG